MDVALALFGDVQGLAIQGSCFKGVWPITSALALSDSKILGFNSLSQISPPCKVLVTDPVCFGFTSTKVLCVPICSWGKGLFSKAGPQQP